MGYLRLIVPAWLVYLLLTNNWEVSNIMVGGIVSAAVVWLLRPQLQPLSWRRVPDALLALLHYLVILVVDIVKNGIVVARIVVSPSLPIQPGIVAIPSLSQSELATALSAHAITLTPGELVLEIGDDGTMYTHCLDATHPEETKIAAQRLRTRLLHRMFE